MSMKPYVSTFTIGYAALGELYELDPPNDLVIPATVWPFQRQPLYPDIVDPGKVSSSLFDVRDKILLSAVRVNCPFSRGLLVNQAQMGMKLYGTYGGSGAPHVENWPFLKIDLSAPWGEWIPVNRFIEFVDPSPGTKWTAKAIFAYFDALTVQTKLLDSVWAGQPSKIEVDLRIFHAYPSQSITYTPPGKVEGVVLLPGPESILAQWDPDPEAVHYKVFRQTLFQPEEMIATVDSSLTLYNDGFLVSGQTYNYRIVAHNFGGDGPSSDTVSAVAG